MNGRCVAMVAVLSWLSIVDGSAARQDATSREFKDATARDATASVWDGVYTEAQAQRGETAYRQACVNCHGPELEGADMTPPLTGGTFSANWNDLSLGDLFERIRATMPLDKPGTLSRQQNADLVAFLLKANQWPAGTTELSRELGALKRIRIQSSKPDPKP